MADVRPFRALRPRDDLAREVIAPPYDVLSEAEARELATNRRSFLRVTRSEVDLPQGSDSHSEAAYQMARTNLERFIDDRTLVQDDEATYYVYGQTMGDHSQLGFIAACSVDEYDKGTIKKHEFTRPDKEDDRTHHMEVLDAQVGLVFLAYPASSTLSAILQEVAATRPAWSVTTEDDVQHRFWALPTDQVERTREAFAAVSALYIADGHHRSAAASRVHANRGDERSAYFVAGLYPDDQLQVMAYNRVVHDLNGMSPTEFIAAVGEVFDIDEAETPVPLQRGRFTMYLEGRWHLLTPRSGVVPHHDPVGRLDVAVLQDRVLGPLLGIDDPRRSERIHFVGGIRGHQALERAVDNGAAVAFHLFPTGLDQLFEVADAGEVMPPKSTWFEPKLREGVVVRRL